MTFINETQKYNAAIEYLKKVTPATDEQADEIEQIITMCEKKISQRITKNEETKAKQTLAEDVVMKHMTTELQTACDLYFDIYNDDKITESYKMPAITAACKRLIAAGKIVREDVLQNRKLVYAYKLA